MYQREKNCSLKLFFDKVIIYRNLEARTSENQTLLSSILTTEQSHKGPSQAQARLVLEARD